MRDRRQPTVDQWERTWEAFVAAEKRCNELNGRKMSRAHYIKSLRRVWELAPELAKGAKLPCPY